MARAQRNDIDYFPHSVKHGKKMFYIRSKFGNDGYAVWFMLLEQLGKTNYHYLDLKDEVQLMYLSSEFKVDENILMEIINTLVKFDEFDKELWEKESILYNEKFVDNIKDAYKKRSNECVSKTTLLILLTSKGRLNEPISIPKQPKSNPKGGENPQSKVKYTKEKDIIIDEFENLIEELKNSTEWINGLAIQYKITPKQVWSKCYYWLNEQKLDNNLNRDVNDIKIHFRRTLKLQQNSDKLDNRTEKPKYLDDDPEEKKKIQAHYEKLKKEAEKQPKQKGNLNKIINN